MPELTSTEVEKSHVTGVPREGRTPGRVTYRPVHGSFGRWTVTALVALIATGLMAGYLAWQLHNMALAAVTAGILIAFTIELIRASFTVALSWTAVLAKKPSFVRIPEGDTSTVALVITFVPSAEDPVILEELLTEARKIRYREGDFAIMVLDEGDGSVVGPIVDRVNSVGDGHPVLRVSRYGIPAYNQRSGMFEARTKHGNINAAVDVILRNPEYYGRYDIVMGLDPDHIPMREFADRMLGYFEDPNVAYVVGPQSYSNARTNLVAKLAESQQFVFHSVSQTGANSARSAMMVGTSYAIRMSVLEQVGGIQPSVTEDMATSLAVLTRKNPDTRRMWKSVYTPDLLAHGEGPSTWGAFFKQQDRWSRGAIEYVLTGKLLVGMVKMWRKPLRIIHYGLLMTFYLVMGLAWLLAAGNMVITAIWGPTAIDVPPTQWAAFFAWVAFFQILLYTTMRRYNTSPYEESFSWGVFGMFMSVISAPVYANALIKTVLRVPNGFSITPKGAKNTGDSLFTFRLNIFWVVFYLGFTVLAIALGNMPTASLVWPVLATMLSLAPIILWQMQKASARKQEREQEKSVVEVEQFADWASGSLSATQGILPAAPGRFPTTPVSGSVPVAPVSGGLPAAPVAGSMHSTPVGMSVGRGEN